MKLILRLALCMLSPTLGVSQGYFPLQTGNVWQFSVDGPMHPYLQTESIIGDTVLGNGRSYSVYSGIFFPGRFLRQDGSKVVFFDPTDSTEQPFLDFGATVGDTIARLHVDPSWVMLADRFFNSSFNQEEWTFGYGNGVLSNGGWTIVDSLGLFRVAMEPGIVWILIRALIDGQVRYGHISSVSQLQSAHPIRAKLFPNYPNPFNPSTNIRFYLPAASQVSLKIYDLLGRELAALYQGRLEAGYHSYSWSPVKLSTGTYFCRLVEDKYTIVIRLSLLR